MGNAAVASWKEANPLRRWRTEQNLSAADVAVQVGVSMMSVQLWERGSSDPRDENMVALVRLTGMRDLPMQWQEWREDQPRVV